MMKLHRETGEVKVDSLFWTLQYGRVVADSPADRNRVSQRIVYDSEKGVRSPFESSLITNPRGCCTSVRIVIVGIEPK